MYLNYFDFDEPPFSITPDPKFVFLSKKHEESLAHLVYGITRGGGAGFVQLTGEVGTGKTTISRLLLEQIPEKTNIALILNPTVTPLELIQNICKELKISMRGIKGKLNTLIDKLNNYLLKSWSDGENTVVIIDEAQNLPRDTLEQLRLLTNLETNTHKLLQIILIGQPELRSTMRRNDLRQLAQRVTARYHLKPLSADETYEYLRHRITVAGGDKNIINKATAKKMHALTAGVPRLLNILADRTLLSVFADNKRQIGAKHIVSAAREVLPEANRPSLFGGVVRFFRNYILALIASIVIMFMGYNWAVYQGYFKKNTPQVIELKKIDKPFNQVNYLSFVPASTKTAWQYYFKLWGARNDKNWLKPQCPDSKDTGMACLRRQGNLMRIQKLNHPVLLQLENDTLVLLTAIDRDIVKLLNIQNQIVDVDKHWLEQQWLGAYFMIWPMPAELLINPSEKDLNTWSLEMANTLTQEKINQSQLKNWIIEFQKSQGLLADGIIGKETQMTLSLMAYNGPTLNQ